MREIRVARSELIVGADAAGKRARAQALADAWLAGGPGRRVVCVATAQAWDEDMREMVERLRSGAGESSLVTVEEPTELAHALGTQSRADTLIVVDCLTLWLTASLMEAMVPDASDAYMAAGQARRQVTLAEAVRASAGPLVLVSHPTDARSLPAGGATADAEALLQTLGSLNQQAARACERVTLVTAGQAHTLKEAA